MIKHNRAFWTQHIVYNRLNQVVIRGMIVNKDFSLIKEESGYG